MNRLRQITAILLGTLVLGFAQPTPLSLPVGGARPDVILNVAGEVTLRAPDGARGLCKHSFAGIRNAPRLGEANTAALGILQEVLMNFEGSSRGIVVALTRLREGKVVRTETTARN